MKKESLKNEIVSPPRRKFLKLSSYISALSFLQWLQPLKAFAGGFVAFSFFKKSVAITIKDTYFKYVVLLLSGEGVNAAQNNTILDSSSNNLSLVRSGNLTQGNFSPFGTSWAVYFNGTDYVNTPSSANFNFGTGDFTIECWMYPQTLGALGSFIVCSNSQSSQPYVAIRSGVISFGRTSAYPILLGVSTIPLNTWTHIAITRTSSLLRIFVNGVYESSLTDSTNYTTTSSWSFATNRATDGNWDYFGYLSNLRIVVGTSLYNSNSNFTPSTSNLTVVAGTVLLTCQNNNFKDNSSNNFTLTPSGTARITKFSPFPSPSVGTSGYFDGNGDYLTINNAPASLRDWFTSSYTIEMWIYPIAFTMGSNYESVLIGHMAPTSANDYWSFGVMSSGIVKLYYYNGTPTGFQTAPGVVPLYAWTHIAFVNNGGSNLAIYVNGVSSATATKSGTPQSENIGIPTFVIGQTGNASYNGYISNLRVVSSTAVYTSNFTPPTSPLTAIPNTSLFLNFNNAGVSDSSGYNVIETLSTTQISTSVKKFGNSSIAINGSGSYLNLPTNPIHFIGTGDYTIEGWFYFTALSGEQDFILYDTAGALGFGMNGAYPFIGRRATAIDLTSSTSITAGTWNYLAATRNTSGGTTTTRIYVNGTQTASSTTVNFSYPIAALGVGGVSAGYNMTGYIDDLRISLGFARYTGATHTVPTASLPTS